jgi:hypothetical protein
MLGTVKTTLDEDGKRVGFVSTAEEVVESDMIMEINKKEETLVYGWL